MICPVCKFESKLLFPAQDFISHETFSVFQCLQCKVGFTHPQPEDINRYYPQDYRRFAPFTRWLLQTLYFSRVKSWVKKLGFTGKALEIGSGNGWMLDALHQQGWSVVGFERNEEQASRVSIETGFKVHAGDLSKIGNEKFDLVLLFNVIEHLYDPEMILRQCRDLLSDRGVLIMSTQNLNSFQADFSKADWAHLDVPRHLFHFSEYSFQFILNRVGMKLIRSSTVSWIHDPYGWVASILNKMGFAPSRLTDELMKKNFRGLLNPSGVLLCLVAGVLVVPSLILSIISWMFHRGGLIEVWAKKKLD